MTAVAVLNSERIKLSTTRSLMWSALCAAVLSVGVAALQGATAYGSAPLPPEKAATGAAVFGVPVLMILAAMTVTGEYRSGMIRTTFMATPNRTLVLIAKAIVMGVFSAVYAVLMTMGAVVTARLASPPLVGTHLSLADTRAW